MAPFYLKAKVKMFHFSYIYNIYKQVSHGTQLTEL